MGVIHHKCPDEYETDDAWTPSADGRVFLSASPLTTTFGCSATVGYSLEKETLSQIELYGPVMLTESLSGQQ